MASSMLALSAMVTASSLAVPNYHGCLSASSQKYAYCNHSLTNEDRARSLIEMLTLEEKVGGRTSPDIRTAVHALTGLYPFACR